MKTNKVDNETVFHSYSQQGPCFKQNSSDLHDNIANIFDESNNSSTLKDGFKKLCNRVNQCWSLIQQANMRNK